MKKQKGFTVIELMIIIIIFGGIIFGCIGWGLNIYKLVELDFEEPYKAEVIRGIGVAAAPIGCFIGYMDIGEESQ